LGLLSTALSAADSPTDGRVTLIYTGDIMLADLPGEAIKRGVDPFEPFADIFSKADLVIGNLECVIATKGTAWRKPWTFRADPRVIPLLTKHFDGVSLANNHTGDFGDEAFVEQLDLLKGRLPVFGGGRDLKEAHQPLVLEKNGLRIAFLGYNEFKPRSFEAGENDPGVAWSVDERVFADLKAAKDVSKADVILPFMHWGDEYEPLPNERQQALAHAIVDHGATAVIGAHPHVVQTTEWYHGKPVIYSLGNFVFDGFDEPAAKIGWLARLIIDREGVAEWDTLVYRIDNEGLPKPDFEVECPSGRRGSDEVVMRKPAWAAASK
jgi:poly-gamma-glutamate synthesis protein (capsule biosynthesis protein)